MRVYLRKPTEADAQECAAGARASIQAHRPWVYPATTPVGFVEYLRRIHAPRHESYLVCRKSDDRVAGVININEIIHGAMFGAFVGYWGFEGFTGQGLMSEGLALVFDEAFGPLGLHRLEANVQPGNERSIRMVTRLGMTKEGFSRKYLKIGGEWRDHERWALIAEDWTACGGSVWALERARRERELSL